MICLHCILTSSLPTFPFTDNPLGKFGHRNSTVDRALQAFGRAYCACLRMRQHSKMPLIDWQTECLMTYDLAHSYRAYTYGQLGCCVCRY